MVPSQPYNSRIIRMGWSWCERAGFVFLDSSTSCSRSLTVMMCRVLIWKRRCLREEMFALQGEEWWSSVVLLIGLRSHVFFSCFLNLIVCVYILLFGFCYPLIKDGWSKSGIAPLPCVIRDQLNKMICFQMLECKFFVLACGSRLFGQYTTKVWHLEWANKLRNIFAIFNVQHMHHMQDRKTHRNKPHENFTSHAKFVP